jgi:hypothetical protein
VYTFLCTSAFIMMLLGIGNEWTTSLSEISKVSNVILVWNNTTALPEKLKTNYYLA